jgi:O-antigen ligase
MEILSILIATLNVAILIKNFEKGLTFYFIMVFLAPTIKYMGQTISYEILFFPILLILFILFIKDKTIRFSKVVLLFFVYFILWMLSTFVSINLYNTNVLWIPIIGVLRVAFLLFILTQFVSMDNRLIKKVLTTVLVVNCIFAFIQLSNPSSVIFFASFYGKESQVPLLQMAEMGYFNRAFGSFCSPIYLGAFALMCFAYFTGLLLDRNRSLPNILGLCMALICGILSSTKTFILGVPTLILVAIVLFLISKKTIKLPKLKTINYLLIILLFSVFIGNWAVNYAESKGVPVHWYLAFLQKPFEAFETRYNSSTGVQQEAIEVIKQNPIIGVGFTNPKGEFQGDSFYLGVLHDTGIIGLTIFCLIFMYIIKEIIQSRDTSKFLVFTSLLLYSFAFPAVFNILGVLTIGYAHSYQNKMSINKRRMANKLEIYKKNLKPGAF